MKKFSPINLFSKVFTLIIAVVFFTSPLRADVIYALPLSGAEFQIGNMLEWSTAVENNSQLFMVQRSFDGISYEDVGRVYAAGLSKDDMNYHFMDIGINDQKAYYRLKQLDRDGTASFSQTVIVNKKMTNQFMVMSMSSPEADSRFAVTIDATIEGTMSYQLCSMAGDSVLESTQPIGFGMNELLINLDSENEGVYKVVMRMGDEEETLIIRKVLDAVKKKPNVASQNAEIGG